MIYTVTANPSVDYYLELESLQLGEMNRGRTIHLVPGGKGINVTMQLQRMGVKSCALGFVGGETGLWLRRTIEEMGGNHAFLEIEGAYTRLNVKLCTDVVTECNAPGPIVPSPLLQALEDQVGQLSAQDTLVIGGQLPCDGGHCYYARLLRKAHAVGARTVVDTSGEALRSALPEHPWLVKPNAQELAALSGQPLDSLDAIISAARAMQTQGACNVLVSLGEQGALLLTEQGELIRGTPPAGEVRGTVGAGDSMVAGFLAGWLEENDPCHALRLALAAGSATAFSFWLATPDEIKRCLHDLPPLQTLTQ